jgi:hypothetical protein
VSGGAWLRLDALAWRSPKVAGLPSAALRWLWIVTLSEAKLQKPGGGFGSEDHWLQLTKGAGGDRKGFRALVGVGLLEVAPSLCIRCLEGFHDAPAGTVVVHDWADFQINTNAERTRRWRDKAKGGDALVTHSAVTPNAHVTMDSDKDNDNDKRVITNLRSRMNGVQPISVGGIVRDLARKGNNRG